MLLVFLLCLVACDENQVEKITLSIDSTYAEYTAGVYVIEDTTEYVPVKVEIKPSTMSNVELIWSCAFSDVAHYSNGKLYIIGSGTTTVTAKYRNENGETVTGMLTLRVVETNKPRFTSLEKTLTYTGLELQNADECKVQNPLDEKYCYTYYEDGSSEPVSAIRNVGRYTVKYSEIGNPNNQCTMSLVVEPKEIHVGRDCQSEYGKMPENFFQDIAVTDEMILSGEDLHGGIGDDPDVIGKIVYTTTATNSSNAGRYTTGAKYRLEDRYKNNYNIVVDEKVHTVNARRVVLKTSNKTMTYGDGQQTPAYSLYDYNEWQEFKNMERQSVEPLSESVAPFASNIVGGEYKYYLDGTEVDFDQGLIDVLVDGAEYGEYDLFFYPRTNANITILEEDVLGGKLKVEPKEVVVTPRAMSKTFGENDPSKILWDCNESVVQEKITDFLYIDYQTEDEEIDYREGNKIAPVGKYYYKIDSSKNVNYTFVLDETADDVDKEDTDIVFTVNQCPIIIAFDNLTSFYKAPRGSGAPTVGYYDADSSADYKSLQFKSVKINNQEHVVDGELDNKSETFDADGTMLLETGGKFKILLKMTQVANKGDYFATYNVVLGSSDFRDGANGGNYNVIVAMSDIYVNKIKILVTPKHNEIEYNANQIYSTTQILKDYTTSYDGDINDILQSLTLLSLTDKNGKMYKLDSLGNASPVEKLGGVGKYKLFLSNSIRYVTDKEYYEFELVDGVHTLDIIPQEFIITPTAMQQKVYGADDPTLTYDEEGNTPSDVTLITGGLVRAPGENVGTYEIKLGEDFSFGPNYRLKLNPVKVNFGIVPRQVLVQPTAIYDKQYGDTINLSTTGSSDILIQQVIQYAEGESPLKTAYLPKFNGEPLVLGYEANGTETAEKEAGYYPVRLNDQGQVLPYYILRGEFACENENYDVVYEPAECYISPKDIVVNIIPETKIAGTVQEGPISNFDKFNLSSTLLDGATFEIKELTPTLINKRYVVASADDIEFEVWDHGFDVSDCYKIVLGNKTVYYVGNQNIYFEIFDKDTFNLTNNNVKNVTYNGNIISTNAKIGSLFELYCNPDCGYSIDYEASAYQFSYIRNQSPVDNPTDCGSYVVTIIPDPDTGIVLKKEGSDDTVVLKSLEQENEQSFVGYIATYGQLNITQATIYLSDASKVAFEEGKIYGETTLPNLATTYTNGDQVKPMFVGPNNRAVELYDFGANNFENLSTNVDIASLNVVGDNKITVKIYAKKQNSNEKDTNFAPLVIYDVPLTVLSKTINLLDYPIVHGISDDMEYDGFAKNLYCEVETDGHDDKCTLTSSYYRVETAYEKSSSGKIKGINNKTGLAGTLSLDEISGPYSLNVSSSTLTILNDTIDFTTNILSTGEIKDAGIYLGKVICLANSSNYTLSFMGEPRGASINFVVKFEVTRRDDIAVSNWKDRFYYGTKFDMANQETLPFEYSISPNLSELQNAVYFEPKGDEQIWANTNGTLSVKPNDGEYSVELIISTNNYFYIETKNFKIDYLPVEFGFPTLTTYGFIGENIPVDSFKESISTTRKDKDGNEVQGGKSFYRPEYDDYYTFKYFTADGDPLEGAPWQIGDYLLKVTYGDVKQGETGQSYYGEGEFYYSITKNPFKKQISFKPGTIVYDPSYTAEQLYSLVLYGTNGNNGMFTIDTNTSTDSYEIILEELPDIVLSPDSDTWVKNFNKCGTKNLRITVKFNDGVTADYVENSVLEIKQKELEGVFEIKDGYDARYTGFAHFNELTYLGLNLAPNYPTRQTLNEIYEIVSSGLTTELYDCAGNKIATVTYRYSAFRDNVYIPLNSAPIVPGMYQVEYGVAIGDNYKLNTSSSTIPSLQVFEITKVDLYISLKVDMLAKTYDEDDLFTDFSVDFISVSNDPNNLNPMHVSLIKNSSSYSYQESDGVAIAVLFFEVDETAGGSTETMVNHVINAGKYKLVLSLYCHGSYFPQNYFNSITFTPAVNINRRLLYIDEFMALDNIYNGQYRHRIEENLEVSAATPPTLLDVIEITAGEYNLTGDTLTIYEDTEFMVKSSMRDLFDVSIEKFNGTNSEPTGYTSFAEIVDDGVYKIYVKSKNLNYSNGSYITIIKNFSLDD